jgi:uncharacterized repeat protein (TIGR03803 family)
VSATLTSNEKHVGRTGIRFIVFFAAAISGASAQTFNVLATFNATSGVAPVYVSLIQGTAGNFDGTASGEGGAPGNGGTVFQVNSSGSLKAVHSFDITDGAYPDAGVIQARDGNFYGTTSEGGKYGYSRLRRGYGTIFKITPGGTLTSLHSFDLTDGADPQAALVQGTDGYLYGTTLQGGANYGTVFKITTAGKFTTLHNFSSTEGFDPVAGLIQATDGNLYGSTLGGGSLGNYGTIFKISPGGTLTTLHSFNKSDGQQPFGTLVQATDGNFYGTTNLGGAYGFGTVFKMDSSGNLTTLYNFNYTDGSGPDGTLIQATDGNLYGTTGSGGAGPFGTIFAITLGGTLTTLHSFDQTDGTVYGGLLQATNGDFYGTATTTVYSLSMGLGPFIKTLPTAGTAGSAVKILGTNLTGATSVSFDGTAAVFTVVSPSEIKTTVPAGATTGTVQVSVPGGTLASNIAFHVLP